MNTKQKGEISEVAITLALLKKGFSILKPLGENHRYDLVIDDGTTFKKVQCKTARYEKGSLVSDIGRVFYTKEDKKATKTRYTVSEVDVIALYSPDFNKCYLIPSIDLVDDSLINLKSSINLRVDSLKSPQGSNIKFASKYEI